MKTSFSSSHDRNKSAKDNTYMTPLTPQFFNQLIKLETEFNNKTYNAQTLDELTQYYAEAVEYYDSVKDPISSYFIFKIQDTLTTKKSLGILMRETAKAHAAEHKEKDNASVETASTTPPESAGQIMSPNNKNKVTFAMDAATTHIIHENSGDESSDDDDEEEKQIAMKEKQRKAKELTQSRGRKKSFGTIKNTKQKMFTHQLKLQSQKVHEKQNLVDFMVAFAQASQQIDKVVLYDLDSQKSIIRSRIARRKKDTFINHTQNSSGFLRDRGDITIESVLKGLEEEDSMQNPLSNNSNDEKLEERSEEKTEEKVEEGFEESQEKPKEEL